MNRPSQRVQVPTVHPHPVRSLDRHPDPDRDPSHVLDLTQQVPIGVAVAVDAVAAVRAAVRVIVVMARSEQRVCIHSGHRVELSVQYLHPVKHLLNSVPLMFTSCFKFLVNKCSYNNKNEQNIRLLPERFFLVKVIKQDNITKYYDKLSNFQ
jgi:hypothetical protein